MSYNAAILEWHEQTILVGSEVRIYVEVTNLGSVPIENATYSVTRDGVKIVASTAATVDGNEVGALVEITAAGAYEVTFTFEIGDETLARRVIFKGVA